MTKAKQYLAKEEKHLTRNYHPLPVVLSEGNNVWVKDVDGKEYIDCLAGYSSLNFGHLNQRLMKVAYEQMSKLTMASRAFCTDKLGAFCEALVDLTGLDMALPMNTGAEAVESGIKLARAWGYRVKGVPEYQANIITMSGNFHGRTTTIISFSSDPTAKKNFGPFTPGFRQAEYGNLESVLELIDENTVGILFEPIQGEAGVIIPPAEFVQGLRKVCDERNILLIADEIQSGLCRSGYSFTCDMFGIKPDLMLLGKALGGGIYPVSAVVGRQEVMQVLQPGQHGSTFGGNPLAAAIGYEVCQMVAEGQFQKLAVERGERLRKWIEPLVGNGVLAYRAAGLWFGIDIDPEIATGREVCEKLFELGILAKDTHGSTVRISPPLTISEAEIDILGEKFQEAIRLLKMQ